MVRLDLCCHLTRSVVTIRPSKEIIEFSPREEHTTNYSGAPDNLLVAVNRAPDKRGYPDNILAWIKMTSRFFFFFSSS